MKKQTGLILIVIWFISVLYIISEPTLETIITWEKEHIRLKVDSLTEQNKRLVKSNIILVEKVEILEEELKGKTEKIYELLPWLLLFVITIILIIRKK